MRGAIYYYSSTGNTRLACEYLAHRTPAIAWELVDITQQAPVDPAAYDCVGIASWVDYAGPPKLMQLFLDRLPKTPGKPTFILITCGGLSGRTLPSLQRRAEARGLKVVAGHVLNTPENYPPSIKSGDTRADSPSPANVAAFDAFIATLNGLLADAAEGKPIKRVRLGLGLPNDIIPVFPRKTSRWLMGKKHVEAELCTQCGLCARECPYHAISLSPLPVFDEDKCYGCWRCYNRCPKGAIRAKGYEGEHRYPKPNQQLRDKLGA